MIHPGEWIMRWNLLHRISSSSNDKETAHFLRLLTILPWPGCYTTFTVGKQENTFLINWVEFSLRFSMNQQSVDKTIDELVSEWNVTRGQHLSSANQSTKAVSTRKVGETCWPRRTTGAIEAVHSNVPFKWLCPPNSVTTLQRLNETKACVLTMRERKYVYTHGHKQNKATDSTGYDEPSVVDPLPAPVDPLTKHIRWNTQ